jgi:hypothetical protein
MITPRHLHLVRAGAPSKDAPTLAARLAVLHGQLPESYVAALLGDPDTSTVRRALSEAANVPYGDA